MSAACTILKPPVGREYNLAQAGGRVTGLASYPLMAITKMFAVGDINAVKVKPIHHTEIGIDLLSRMNIPSQNAIACGTVGIGA